MQNTRTVLFKKRTHSLIKLALCILLTLPSFAWATTLVVQVNGLVCAFCAKGITESLEKQSAVDEVWVSLEQKLVAIQLKEDAVLEEKLLRKSLEDAGYSVVKITQSDAPLSAIKASKSEE